MTSLKVAKVLANKSMAKAVALNWVYLLRSAFVVLLVLFYFSCTPKRDTQQSPPEKVPTTPAPGNPQGNEPAGALKVRVTHATGTLLKDQPRPSQESGVRTCVLPVGVELTLAEPPQSAVGGHLRVRIRDGVNGAASLATCSLKNPSLGVFDGFLFTKHITAIGFELPTDGAIPVQPPETQTGSGFMARYDEATAQNLARKIKTFVSSQGTQCGAAHSKGLCYQCVGQLLGEPLRNGQAIWPMGIWEELNAKTWARSFADAFNQDKALWEQRLKMAPIHASVTPEKAPVGSIIVWQGCSDNPAGHIEIVTQIGTACSDFCRPITACDKLLGIYIPVK